MRRYGGSPVRFEATCGDVAQTLKALTRHGISLYDVVHKSELSVRFSVSSDDVNKVKQILGRRGDGFEQLISSPGSVFLNRIKKRWVLLLAIIFIFGFSIWLPTRIFFVNVTGNSAIPTAMVEEKVAELGVCFGVKRAEIRSEALKNAMLSQMPELDWVGITTAGCVATVEIREKPSIEKKAVKSENVASIIANTDGVIEEITVTKGIALCNRGQAVKKGQVLISGYEDCGLFIKATQAQGEVTAQTMRQIDAICPSNISLRCQERNVETSYRLLIGKKFINFKNNSGISPASCVKIYEQKYLTLPGGFRLPIALVKETVVSYETKACELDEADFHWIGQMLDLYTVNQMSAGTILSKKSIGSLQEDYFRVKGFYICREQIGKYRIEEIRIHDRKDS